jgi:hypothetical protein
MSPVHVQFPKMMVCMLQIINLDNVQVFYTHPGEGVKNYKTMTKDKVTALSSLFLYNKTIDYYIRSKYQDMRTSRLGTQGDLT